jgi:hypothetical protein
LLRLVLLQSRVQRYALQLLQDLGLPEAEERALLLIVERHHDELNLGRRGDVSEVLADAEMSLRDLVLAPSKDTKPQSPSPQPQPRPQP